MRFEKTIQFRWVLPSREAVLRADVDRDTKAGFWGRDSLTRQVEEDRAQGVQRYNSGDCVEDGDIRTLFGVVGWYPDM